MVFGRTRKTGRNSPRAVDPDKWFWTPEPVHPALVDTATWDAAQRVAAERGNTRGPEMPTTQPGRRYALRSRVRDNACQHRMTGTWRSGYSQGASSDRVYVYYKCPYNPSDPRQVAAHPGHPPASVSVREDTLLKAIGSFLDDYLFGHDRAAMLA